MEQNKEWTDRRKYFYEERDNDPRKPVKERVKDVRHELVHWASPPLFEVISSFLL